jgi:hypothetical protein
MFIRGFNHRPYTWMASWQLHCMLTSSHLEWFSTESAKADKLTELFVWRLFCFWIFDHVDVGHVSDVSDIYAASTFSVHVSRVGGCLCVYRLLIQQNGEISNIFIALANPVTVNPDQTMNKAVQSWVHTFRHMTFKKAGKSLVCSDKTCQFLKTCIITPNNKYNFWVFCRCIHILYFYSF